MVLRQSTGPPMTSFPRFDLHEIGYPIAILANQTPAWREVYAEILEQCAARYTTHWAAVDWLNQIGEDPAKDRYPRVWKGTIIPAEVFGQGYNTPGWTGNGLGPNGLFSSASYPLALVSSPSIALLRL